MAQLEVDSIDAPATARRCRPDRGASLLEHVVTIFLMGTGVVAVLVGLQTSVGATVNDQHHANAFEWLQAASDAVHLIDRVPCTSDGTGRSAALAAYDAAAAAAPMPTIWEGTDATIGVIDVEYLGRTSVDAEFEWSPTFCFEGATFVDSPLYTQRVTIEVTMPGNGATQTLEMVKSE